MNKKSRAHTLSTSKGFTLIELLVVIAIIGILASIVLASLNTARKKGRDARRIADMKQLQLALELYYDGNSSTYIAQGTAPTVFPAAATAMGLGALAPAYIASLPADPTGGTSYNYQYASLNGTTLCGAVPCTGYILVSRLEAASNPSTFIGAVGTTAVCPAVPATAPFPYCVKQ